VPQRGAGWARAGCQSWSRPRSPTTAAATATAKVPGSAALALGSRSAKAGPATGAVFHVVFTLPAPDRRHQLLQNKECRSTAALRHRCPNPAHHRTDPKHWERRIGRRWCCTLGLALTHHPHVHGIVPAGAWQSDADRWVGCRRDSSCQCACSPLVPAPVPGSAHSGSSRWQSCSSSASMPARRSGASPSGSCVTRQRVGRVRQAPLRPVPKAVLIILSRYTHRVLSPTAGSRLRRARRHLPLEDYRAKAERATRQ